MKLEVVINEMIADDRPVPMDLESIGARWRLKKTWKECAMCQWITDSLVRKSLAMLVPKKGT